MRTHLAEGNVTEAFRAYETFRTFLLGELGVAPTATMQALVSSVRRSSRERAVAS